MKKALGLVEIKGLATAILVADTMAKTANITITQVENTKGLGWMTVKITGDVGAVTAAVNAGKQMGVLNGDFVSAKILPRPSDFVEMYFCQKDEERKLADDKKKEEKINTDVNEIEKVEEKMCQEDTKNTLKLDESENKIEESVLEEQIKEEVQIVLEDSNQNQESTQEKSETEVPNLEEHLNESGNEIIAEKTDEESSTDEVNDETVKKSTKKRAPKPKTNQ